MLDNLSHNPAVRTAGSGDFAARAGAFLQPVASSLLRIVRAIKGRRAAYRLATLDDQMLQDIGLTRFEVESALAMPLTSDPNAELVRRRADRIASQRRRGVRTR
ncbi:uncharacterized protein YjiS (DUF1127 family) [Rhodopseudomonas julia]|uniref:Uncharacterized protein YjiS (DUF1127 family) n=1 Tax=Rhodopseudomonas julia TaxID=200617 RepID=A0ABU0C5B5_9BRAD|nr:hypothetical protein [Rhodopseudomonas julia]MDQ0325710.1 uncharacterized protein YjiS (DUF1127 family) [Rhodopseudomonas julia]